MTFKPAPIPPRDPHPWRREPPAETFTVAELREQAKEAEITGYSSMTKAELIAALDEE